MTMRTRAAFLVLLAAVWCSLAADSRAGLQPVIDSLEDTTTVVDSSGATLDWIASGGECPSPDADRDDWQKDGDAVYVWSYDDGPEGLTGRPTPNGFPGADAEGDQDTLRLNKDEGGQVSVIVYAVQRWKARDGRVAITRSPAS